MALVDAQSVKLAPRLSQHRGLDAHKLVNGRKRQLLSDSGGRIWRVVVHAANGHDSRAAQPLLPARQGLRRFRRVVMDYERQPASHAAWLLVANLIMSLRRATTP